MAMIDDLRALAVFAKTVETGSFRAAADALGLSPSVVSHHVAQLEARLGVALLYRSTRRLSLSHDGQALFEHARAMLAAAESGFAAVAAGSEPTGKLTVTLPAFFAASPLLDALAAFSHTHPKVALDLQFGDAKRDLIRDGLDLAIRIGALTDSTLKARRLFDMPRCLVASPGLMARFAAPQRPEDLAEWDWIGFKPRPNRKQLIDAAGEAVPFSFAPRLTVDSVEALGRLAEAGVGLATPPRFLVAEALRAGRLIEVLPDWRVESLGVYAVWPPNAPRDGLARRLVDFLEARAVRC
ncbi:LysR family transcriptional regulator [Neisseriaceae bacterium JH1-16]|nr:LysR family transcriptional regulator [Neisseriaceae bacterium JH1-16]